MKKIAVFTSGGDAPGMNACLRAVVRSAEFHGLEVLGIRQGYKGMIEDRFEQLTARSVSGIIQRGGTILGSARSEEFRTSEGRKKAAENLKKHNIEGVVAIGGDGTFKGASVLMEEYGIPCVGVPGTIDNDLYGTDFTIGYDTAINTAMEAIDKIKDTADSHNRLFFVEVMGRDAGYIALRTGIATGAEAILIPESITDIDRLVEELKNSYHRKNTSGVVVVAEGDDAGGAFEIGRMVKERLDYFEIRVAVLGHIQRGGSPSCMDRILSSRLGMESVKALLGGQKGVMVGQIHKEIIYTPFEKAIKHTQELNSSLLDLAGILAT